MRGIKRKICAVLFAMTLILLGAGQAFAGAVREFTLHKGQSMFISVEHLQNSVMLTSGNDAVASVLNGVITANSAGETFCKEIRTGAGGEIQEKRFKIKVLPPKLIRYIFVEPNNPRPGEDLKLVAIADAAVDRVKFLVTTNLGRFEAMAEEKCPDGECFIHRAKVKPRGYGKFTVKAQVQSGSNWLDVPNCSFDGVFTESSAANPAEMRVSDRCIDYIKAKEGFRARIMEDGLAKNVYDIGYGSGVRAGAAFYNNVTRAAAHAMLVNRLNNGNCSRALNNFILRNGLRVSQNEFDALSSFTYNLGAGWLSNSNLRNVFLRFKNTNSLNTSKPQKKMTGTIVSINGLRMREGPSTQTGTLVILRFNEQVEVLSENRNGWHRVRTSGGLEGYCFAEFLSVITEYTNSNIGVVNSSDGLKLRKGPSTENTAISVMKFNERVEVLSENNNGWYKVRTSDDLVGYCAAQFLTVEDLDVRNSASRDDFAKAFLEYNKAGGRFIRGLLNRRIEELQIYFYGDYARDGGKNKYNFSLPDYA